MDDNAARPSYNHSPQSCPVPAFPGELKESNGRSPPSEMRTQRRRTGFVLQSAVVSFSSCDHHLPTSKLFAAGIQRLIHRGMPVIDT